MPWYNCNCPNLALGSLKSFAEKRLDDVEIDVLNFHLRLAFQDRYFHEFYRKIMKHGDVIFSETLYSNLLFPELPIFTDYKRSEKRKFEKIFEGDEDMEFFLKKLKEAQDKILESVNWSEYNIVGFTTSFIQLQSSLYAIRWIKERFPKIKILIGGSNAIKEVGKTLLENFEDIDMAISGEGELNFYHLLQSISKGDESYKKLPGVIYRKGTEVFYNEGDNRLKDMDKLEVPDYSDYFNELKKLGIENKDKVDVPLEFSRGCFHGDCSFCNNDIFIEGYRMKSVEKFIDEMKYFVDEYGIENFRFVDNLIPESKLRELFKKIKGLNVVKNIFVETVGSMKPSTLKILSESAESPTTQTGIESLSSSILRKMNKPTTLIGNVQTKKFCELYGIESKSNCMLSHPSITENEFKETVRNINLINCYEPLDITVLSVNLFSDICYNPEKYGIDIKGNLDNYKYFFPDEIRESLQLLYKEYDISPEEKERWDKIRDKIIDWRKKYNRMQFGGDVPVLYHFKKDNKTVIVRRKIDGQERYELEGTDEKVYHFCETAESLKEIKKAIEEETEEDIKDSLERLKKKKLFFESDGKFIALPLDLDKYYESRT